MYLYHYFDKTIGPFASMSDLSIEEANNVLRDIKETKPTNYYNLDMIISVGYRVRSQRGVQFRIWASGILKEYMRKGFAMDDQRLKELGGGGYFKELLERIRDIHASEKVFYRQILEIYATSIDYDPTVEESVQFFKKVQNKIHHAISGETAAEVIYHRVDAEKEFMGQLVSGYLDFAERQAEREVAMTMKDWSEHLDRILISTGEQLYRRKWFNITYTSYEQS